MNGDVDVVNPNVVTTLLFECWCLIADQIMLFMFCSLIIVISDNLIWIWFLYWDFDFDWSWIISREDNWLLWLCM